MSTFDKYAMSKKEESAFRAGEAIDAATLTDDMRDLLAAVRDALDLPVADTAEDHQARAEILDRRASDALIILDAVIRGDRIQDCARQLRGWTAERPATSYGVWVPAEQDGEGRS